MVVSAFCQNTTMGEVMIAHAKDSHGFCICQTPNDRRRDGKVRSAPILIDQPSNQSQRCTHCGERCSSKLPQPGMMALIVCGALPLRLSLPRIL